MTRRVRTLVVILALALAPALALGQAPQQYDAMIHVFDGGFLDASGANGTLVKAGGLVAVMSFKEQNATPHEHTVTSDDGRSFDLTMPPPDNADGYTLATFSAPTTPGRYPYHDKDAPDHHGLLIVAGSAANPTKASPAFTGPTLALAVTLVLALGRKRRRG